MPRSASSVRTQYVAALVIALAIALLAGCDGSGGIVDGDQDTPIDFGETDTTKQLDIQNTSDQDITFELLVNYGDGPKDWLTYSPITAECGPAQSVVFTLEADRSVLPAGLWEAEVVATSGAIRKSVMISIAVVAAATNTNTHNFWTSSEPLEFAVWNAGGGTLQYAVAEVPAWLAVENGTGTSTGPTDRKTVTLSPNRSGLAPGTYSDQVAILPVNGLSTFRKTIDVTMTVLPPGVPALTIQATPTSGDAPLEVHFKAMNGSVLADDPTAGYTIKWDFGDDTTVGQGNQVSHRFASSGTFLVTLSLVGALGTFDCHQATITVNSDPTQPGALVVTPTDDAIFSGPPGGPYTSVNGVTSYNLKNVGGKSISWTAGAGAPSWVSVTKGSGMVDPGMTDTASITVNSNANNLTAGNYSGSVVFATPDGTVITTRKVSLKITPIAKDDSYSTNEDKTLNVMAVAGVLANDPGHGQLPAVLVSGPSHGSITLNPNGSFSYTPAANFNSSDSFSYRLTDGTLSSNTATVSITVKPVNDPPGFAVPADQSMSLNSTIQVAMTAVSPGPTGPMDEASREASQKVTFTATSSNQAVVRDADLRFDGSDNRQLTITAIGTGSTTITVKATDDGGTTDDRGVANGGADTTTKTFGVTAFDGVPISGTVSLVETVGARPRFGQHGLVFTGTGASAGQNFTTMTDVDGHYTQPVPEGWTGTITAQDPSRLVFLDPATKAGYNQQGQDVSVQKITTPVTRPGLAGQDIVAWTTPIGIPSLAFGITEVAPSPPNPWTTGTAGFYYIDQYNPQATDSSNPYGTPQRPRKSIPGTLPAGSVVEIHNLYDLAPIGRIQVTGTGNASQPIFVRGASSAARPTITKEIRPAGRYIILENLDIVGARVYMIAPCDHIVLRHCALHDANGTAVATGAWSAGVQSTDMVIYDNHIYRNGSFDPDGSFTNVEHDCHGVNALKGSERVWILDNNIEVNQGDGVQIQQSQFIYIGRNAFGHHGENAVDMKVPKDILISQNSMHGYYDKTITGEGGGNGEAATCHNAMANADWPYPERIWFLFNDVSDCQRGFRAETGTQIYAIGNVFHNVWKCPNDTHTANSPWLSGAAITATASVVTIMNNTASDVDLGIGALVYASSRLSIINNIITGVKTDTGYHIAVINEGTGSAEAFALSQMDHNLLQQAGRPVRIRWNSGPYDVARFITSFSGLGNNCIEQDPLFAAPSDGIFRLEAASPAVNAGAMPAIYQTFFDLYGTSIDRDADGAQRPQGVRHDIGAFER